MRSPSNSHLHFKTIFSLPKSLMASSFAQTLKPDLPQHLDDLLCSDPQKQQQEECSSLTKSNGSTLLLGSLSGYLSGESRIERAWAHWTNLGRPKLIVAPMVDNSELPFRLLCRKYGAEAAYTPMLHSRIFTENEKYRNMEFTTCQVSDNLKPFYCVDNLNFLFHLVIDVLNLLMHVSSCYLLIKS